MGWLTGKSATRSRAGDIDVWRTALAGEFEQAEHDGPLCYGHYERIVGQHIEAVFLTPRNIYLRCFSPVSRMYYGPLTVVPLDRIFLVGPVGDAHSTRWGLVVAYRDADVEIGEEPLGAYLYEGGTTREARSLTRRLLAELQAVAPAGTFRVLPYAASTQESTRLLETGLLFAATLDTPDLHADLERAREVLDARSRGLPIPDRHQPSVGPQA